MQRSTAAAILVFAMPLTAAWGQGVAPAVQSPFVIQMWTLNGRYTDARHGVSFRYPKVWQATTHFGMHAPALSKTELLTPAAGFGYGVDGNTPASAPYGQTTTEGFGIVYAAVHTANASACDALSLALAASPVHGTTILHGRSYTTRETSSAGMSQSISGTLYTTYAGTTCYLFETVEANMSTGVNDNERASTPEESRLLASGLNRVMGTVRIHPRR